MARAVVSSERRRLDELVKNQASTVGRYLAQRLAEVGVRHYFTVPGDFNLLLLDQLGKNTNLKLINCCNELNAGYAADGYARANGVSALVVTYGVGALSAINAVAGAFAENLPLIVISGGPNTNSQADNELLHHTLGNREYEYVSRMFAEVTAASIIIRNPEEAPSQIDDAIAIAIARQKPVYIEIACNITAQAISQPHPRKFFEQRTSDKKALKVAVDQAVNLLNRATKPVMVAGVKLLRSPAREEFEKLMNKSHFATAIMPDAKGCISEENANFIGVYWGPVSSPATCSIIEAADAYLFVGPVFSDYTTSGHSLQIDPKKLIVANLNEVRIDGQVYNDVELGEFLTGVAEKIKANDTALKDYRRGLPQQKQIAKQILKTKEKLTTQSLYSQIEQLLDRQTAVIAETGDSWFNGIKLQLPQGAAFEIQMQYGSIGWAVGATLGYELGAAQSCRVVALIGDGSFQLTAQEVSTMIRFGLRPIIFVINNYGYTIEKEIHDGPYNTIKNWNYAGLVDVFNAKDGKGIAFSVETAADLQAAISKARRYDGLCLIEVKIDKQDCSNELLCWGKHVEINNARPLKPRTLFP